MFAKLWTAWMSPTSNRFRKARWRTDPGFQTVLRIARGIGISMEEVAKRLEGKSATEHGDASLAKVLAAITKAEGENQRLAATLKAAALALGGNQTKGPRKR